MSTEEEVVGGMDPRVEWILRPCRASRIGTLAVVCGLLSSGGAVAASDAPLLLPDAPPAGSVLAPAPEAPRSGHASRAPVSARPAPAATPTEPPLVDGVERRPTALTPRQPSEAPIVAAPTQRPAAPNPAATVARAATTGRAQSTRSVFIPRHGQLPDGFGAFVSARVIPVEGEVPDRRFLALAGLLLAVVTIGSGCLTLAVGRAAREV